MHTVILIQSYDKQTVIKTYQTKHSPGPGDVILVDGGESYRVIERVFANTSNDVVLLVNLIDL